VIIQFNRGNEIMPSSVQFRSPGFRNLSETLADGPDRGCVEDRPQHAVPVLTLQRPLTDARTERGVHAASPFGLKADSIEFGRAFAVRVLKPPQGRAPIPKSVAVVLICGWSKTTQPRFDRQLRNATKRVRSTEFELSEAGTLRSHSTDLQCHEALHLRRSS